MERYKCCSCLRHRQRSAFLTKSRTGYWPRLYLLYIVVADHFLFCFLCLMVLPSTQAFQIYAGSGQTNVSTQNVFISGQTEQITNSNSFNKANIDTTMANKQEMEGLADLRHDEEYETYTNIPRDPIFKNSNNNITVREGGKAELPCTIQHLGTKKVVWRRVESDKFLTIGKMAWTPDDDILVQHVKHSEELDDWTLILPKVKESDAGLYECQLTSIGGYHTHVRLNVVGPPITNPEVTLTGTQFVERGGQIQLQCNATGGTQIAEEIDWFKDGNIISGSKYKDYIIFTYRSYEQGALVSTLQVDRATADHAGTYVCRSSYNKLKDIAVQVLVADSSNVKRGMSPVSNLPSSRTFSSTNVSTSPLLLSSSVYLLIGLTIIQWVHFM